jgi:hypothetical protein
MQPVPRVPIRDLPTGDDHHAISSQVAPERFALHYPMLSSVVQREFGSLANPVVAVHDLYWRRQCRRFRVVSSVNGRLRPLATADANAYNYSSAVDYTHRPLPPVTMTRMAISVKGRRYLAAHPAPPDDPT